MEKLKQFRNGLGISQELMARKLGITLSMYEKVETGRAGASAAFMKRFKKAFPEVIIDSIFFAEQPQSCCSLMSNQTVTPTETIA